MIQNTSATILLALFWIFLFVLKDYLRKVYEGKMENNPLMKHLDLILIFPGFISLIIFSILLMQTDLNKQNDLLLVWIELAVLMVGPFIYLIIVGLIKTVVESFKKKRNKQEHD